jgi:branched-chain amino acid transport system substrate-binding protein
MRLLTRLAALVTKGENAMKRKTLGRRAFAMVASAIALSGASAVALALLTSPVAAQKKYDEGASDTEIKIGHTNPYSGNASAYGTIGKAIDAYFKKINEEGGINGRKITFITYDDGYSPPKTREMVRKLVEVDKVLFLFQTLGTPPNTMIWDYLNEQKVPQLFVATGASKWGDPKGHPWTMGFQPDYVTEAIIYAKHILANVKDPKIAVLMQNDDYGKDYYNGFKQGLGTGADKIVKLATYEVADPTVDSQIIQLKDTGANVFFSIATPKFAAQAIKKAAEIGWKPAHYINNVSTSIATVMKPAGFENSQGIISAYYLKDPTDPTYAKDKDFLEWKAFMLKYYPNGNLLDASNAYAFAASNLVTIVLKQCGDDLTRANIMRQAANLKNIQLPMVLEGIKVNTSPTDFYPIQSVRMARFKGESWELFGDIISHENASN